MPLLKRLPLGFLALLVAAGVFAAGAVEYLAPGLNEQPPLAHATTSVPDTNVDVTPLVRPAEYPGMRHYRNDEFGFEFWYPENWELATNMFGGASKLNLTLRKIDGEHTNHDEIIVVNPKAFSDRSQRQNYRAATSSTIVVDGVEATKYESVFEGVPTISVYVPFGEYTIVFAFEQAHKTAWGGVLSSLKFLK